MKRTAFALLTAGSLFLGGCISPSRESTDNHANYQYVFPGIESPEPVVVHSHVERLHRAAFGVVPLSGERAGDWQFELVASPAWIVEMKAKFTPIAFPKEFADKWQLPAWFTPTGDKFSAWEISGGSYPLVRMFVEKNPKSPENIRVFIRRH
jgi:hypothetical protein